MLGSNELAVAGGTECGNLNYPSNTQLFTGAEQGQRSLLVYGGEPVIRALS